VSLLDASQQGDLRRVHPARENIFHAHCFVPVLNLVHNDELACGIQHAGKMHNLLFDYRIPNKHHRGFVFFQLAQHRLHLVKRE
jgi:hypothetical protein